MRRWWRMTLLDVLGAGCGSYANWRPQSPWDVRSADRDGHPGRRRRSRIRSATRFDFQTIPPPRAQNAGGLHVWRRLGAVNASPASSASRKKGMRRRCSTNASFRKNLKEGCSLFTGAGKASGEIVLGRPAVVIPVGDAAEPVRARRPRDHVRAHGHDEQDFSAETRLGAQVQIAGRGESGAGRRA